MHAYFMYQCCGLLTNDDKLFHSSQSFSNGFESQLSRQTWLCSEKKNVIKGRARVKIVLILNLLRIVGSSSSCYDTKCCLAEQVIARFVDCEAKNARRVLQINFSSFPELKCSMLRNSTHVHELFNFQCNVGKIYSKNRDIL